VGDVTAKDSSDPTPQEIQQAIEMIRKVKAHLGITDVSAKDSISSSPPTSTTTGVFSNDRFEIGGPTWDVVLAACFEWEDHVRGVTLRYGEYEMISEVKLA
jgi:hypothetical protein